MPNRHLPKSKREANQGVRSLCVNGKTRAVRSIPWTQTSLPRVQNSQESGLGMSQWE